MKILFIGDIVSRPGRQTVEKLLPQLKKELEIDLVLANAENLAGGRGVTENTLFSMMEAGIDYFSSGNHIFHNHDWDKILDDPVYRILRPANYPETTPGKGYTFIQTEEGKKVLFINLLGKIFFGPNTALTASDPFSVSEKILEETKNEKPDIILIDFHAESTSEKKALSLYLDGKITAFIGTHTHVPTADNRILPKGTAYVTDAGMTGSLNSVLGVKKEIIWDLFRKPQSQSFEWVKKGPSGFNSVLIQTESATKSKEIQRQDFILENTDLKGKKP